MHRYDADASLLHLETLCAAERHTDLHCAAVVAGGSVAAVVVVAAAAVADVDELLTVPRLV